MESIEFHIVDPDRTIIIEQIESGYLVSWFDRYFDSDELYLKRTPFEENHDNDTKPVIDMLWHLLDALGVHEGIEITATPLP